MFLIIWISNILALSVPDEGSSGNNLIRFNRTDVVCLIICDLLIQLYDPIEFYFSQGRMVLQSSPRSGQTKDYNIGVYCFSAEHAAIRRKSEDWLDRNQDNVFEWCDISFRILLVHRASTIKIQLSVLV